MEKHKQRQSVKKRKRLKRCRKQLEINPVQCQAANSLNIWSAAVCSYLYKWHISTSRSKWAYTALQPRAQIPGWSKVISPLWPLCVRVHVRVKFLDPRAEIAGSIYSERTAEWLQWITTTIYKTIWSILVKEYHSVFFCLFQLWAAGEGISPKSKTRQYRSKKKHWDLYWEQNIVESTRGKRRQKTQERRKKTLGHKNKDHFWNKTNISEEDVNWSKTGWTQE